MRCLRLPSMLALTCVVSMAPARALDFELSIGSIELPSVAAPVDGLRLHGRLRARNDALRLEAARLSLRDSPLGAMEARIEARLERNGDAAFDLQRLDTPSGRLHAALRRHEGDRHGDLHIELHGEGIELGPLVSLVHGPIPALAEFDLQATGRADLHLRARRDGGTWSGEADIGIPALDATARQGRDAVEGLHLALEAQVQALDGQWTLQAVARLAGGQAYIEPVFVDFRAAPAELAMRLRGSAAGVTVENLDWNQAGLGRLYGRAELATQPLGVRSADLIWNDLHLGPAFATYLQPFGAGQNWARVQLQGRSDGHAQIRDGRLEAADLSLHRTDLDYPPASLKLEGIDAHLHWARLGDVAPSQLRWQSGHLSGVALGASRIDLRARDRNLSLLAPLRVPLAGGAIELQRLDLLALGTPALDARLDASIQTLDLSVLTQALGWPALGGSLAGKLPGVRLSNGNLEIDGQLQASVFDGHLVVEALRVLDLFGGQPRVAADLHLRGLDLGLLTEAFEFGRIEGRLDGDIENLRLRNGRPVAFDARLRTPPGDRSRRRISQRAIDTLSSIGGGPSGLLSRGALGLFESFAYARLGWSCILRDGICQMDGVAPSDDGGFVLVQGRWLPRIDVVGYNRRVDWNHFIEQLQAAMDSGPVQVR